MFFSDHHPPLFLLPVCTKILCFLEMKQKIRLKKYNRGNEGPIYPGRGEKERESLHVCVVEATFDGVCSSVQQLIVQGSREERDGIGFG